MQSSTFSLSRFTLLGALLSSTPLFGAGFQLSERSAVGLGRAFSGEAAIADDASIIASNPAGLALLPNEWNYSVGASFINPGADATLFPAITGGNAGPATRDDDIAESALVPYFYLSRKVNEDFVVGLGIFSTYGLRTNYSARVADLVGTNNSEILTINFNPSISYRVNDRLSIGAGFNALYADGELTANSVNLPAAFGGPTPSFGLEGDDWAFGYNVGILYQLTDQTRIGLSYRSRIETELEGSITGSIVGGASFPGDLDIELPATAEFSIFHQLTDKWAIHGDVLWTDWSAFNSIEPRVSTGSPANDALINAGVRTEANWRDAFRYSIGATYEHSSTWTFRAGLAYDESPVNDSFRTLRIPDGDRFWLSVGASYKVSDALTIDAGYTYAFVEDVSLGQNDNGLIGTNSSGEGDIHLLSLGLSGSF